MARISVPFERVPCEDVSLDGSRLRALYPEPEVNSHASQEDRMKRALALSISAMVMLPASEAFGQLLVARDGPVVYGHHHLNTANLDAQKKFFIDTLGGK